MKDLAGRHRNQGAQDGQGHHQEKGGGGQVLRVKPGVHSLTSSGGALGGWASSGAWAGLAALAWAALAAASFSRASRAAASAAAAAAISAAVGMGVGGKPAACWRSCKRV